MHKVPILRVIYKTIGEEIANPHQKIVSHIVLTQLAAQMPMFSNTEPVQLLSLL